jgi:tetratricopeptide (TPR) repeat protein
MLLFDASLGIENKTVRAGGRRISVPFHPRILKRVRSNSQRRNAMVQGTRRRAVRFSERSWKMMISLVVATFAFAGLSSPTWGQGQTYKAPIPKPASPQPPVKEAEKSPAPAAPAKKGDTLDFELEMKKINSLISANDKNADAYFNRGWLYEYKGDLPAAEKDYSKAIELDRKNKDAYYNRGLLYIKMKKYDEAIKDFTELVKLDSAAADALCNRGSAQLQLGRIDLALADFDAGLKIKPGDPDLLYNRGLAFLTKGNKPKAMEDFNKAAQAGHPKAKEQLKAPGPKS